MRRVLQSLICLLLLSPGCSGRLDEIQAESDIYQGIEFEMPGVIEPVFPDYSVSITDFGAINDGQILNSNAFSRAIADVSDHGGGRVVVPRGIWLTGPIVLKSNVDLHVESGALVIFSKNKDLYPLVESNWEGMKTVRCQSPISGRNLENIAITGEGVFDGSGEVWRMVKREKLTGSQWEELVRTGGVVSEDGKVWYPSEGFIKGEEAREELGPWWSDNLEDYQETRDFYRPVMVSLIGCEKVLLDGPVFQNSAAWCLHPLMCENLTVRNIDVRNPWYSQNGDGIDIESCKNTVVYNCTFDVGDDAICIKSGKNQEGRERGMPTENLIVKNCVVYHGHGGVTVGSEMSGGVKNMHISDCTFIGTDVGLRFKSNRGRGGVVEQVYISNVDMFNIPTTAISFNLYYGGLSPTDLLGEGNGYEMNTEVHAVTEQTPQFKDISIKNVTCKGALQAIFLQGLPEMNIENIHLENMTMESEKGMVCLDARGITIKALNLIVTEYPALSFHNAKEVIMDNLDLSGSSQDAISLSGEETEKVTVDGKPVA